MTLWKSLLLVLLAAAVPSQSAWTPLSVAIETSSLTFERFDAEYASRGLPVVIRGGAARWNRNGLESWTPAALRARCGARPLARPCDEGPASPAKSLSWFDPKLIGVEWAGMADVEPAKLDLTTLGDVLDAQQRGAALYLHDCSIDLLCPALFESLRAPSRWFPRDLLLQAPRHLGNFNRCAGHLGGSDDEADLDSESSDNSAASLVWPTLFVAPTRASTGLHIDAGATRFWMAVLHGRKIFRMLHRADGDYDFLFSKKPPGPGGVDEDEDGGGSSGAADADEEEFPDSTRLDADVFAPNVTRHPQLDDPMTTMYEATVEAGDIIFVPNGLPHQVRNMAVVEQRDHAQAQAAVREGEEVEARGSSSAREEQELTIAVAYNYVDRHNFVPYVTEVLQQHIDGDIDIDLLLWYLTESFPLSKGGGGGGGGGDNDLSGMRWSDYATPQLVPTTAGGGGGGAEEALATLLRDVDALHRVGALVQRVRNLSSMPPPPRRELELVLLDKGEDELLLRLAQLIDLYVEKATEL